MGILESVLPEICFVWPTLSLRVWLWVFLPCDLAGALYTSSGSAGSLLQPIVVTNARKGFPSSVKHKGLTILEMQSMTDGMEILEAPK